MVVLAELVTCSYKFSDYLAFAEARAKDATQHCDEGRRRGIYVDEEEDDEVDSLTRCDSRELRDNFKYCVGREQCIEKPVPRSIERFLRCCGRCFSGEKGAHDDFGPRLRHTDQMLVFALIK